MLPYKLFAYKIPAAETYGMYPESKIFQYNSVDPYVTQIEKELEELRSYTEDQMHQLKEKGANIE
ncbi:hypothetical protein SporoP17a_03175 [Sporosarcina ureae]|nr:hypothetical protein SporoP17a_03175 [Sporosarcina ureae]